MRSAGIEIGSADNVVTITTTKQKNHVEPPPTRLRAVPTAQSVTLIDYHANVDEIPQGVLETLAALVAVEVPGGVAASVWRLGSGKPEQTFYRHRKDLLATGLVSNVGTEKQPRYQVSEEGTTALSQDYHDD